MNLTSIPLDIKTRNRLKEMKIADGRESWDALLNRIIDQLESKRISINLITKLSENKKVIDAIYKAAKED